MGDSFRVVIPTGGGGQAPRLGRLGHGSRIRDGFVRVLKILNSRLTTEPRDPWSEEYYEYVGLKLQLRFGAEDMIGVEYGVHREEAIVLVRRFHWVAAKNQPKLPQKCLAEMQAAQPANASARASTISTSCTLRSICMSASSVRSMSFSNRSVPSRSPSALTAG
jgi:hypothetical protein